MEQIAVMQPYLFPYIGYYQLAAHVDCFYFLDDVKLNTRGFVSRNSSLLDGTQKKFSLPVQAKSQNKLISEHNYLNPSQELPRLLHRVYGKSKYYREIEDQLLSHIFMDDSVNLSQINIRSISFLFHYLELPFHFKESSAVPNPYALKSKERIKQICQHHQASYYINLPGGRSLYEHDFFEPIQLFFLETRSPPPHASILDSLFEKEAAQLRAELSNYQTV